MFWSGARSWLGTPLVSTTQYWPGTTSLMVQLPSAPVVQVLVVVVSSAPWGGAPFSGRLSTNRVNTAPARALPASSCLWIRTLPRVLLVKVQVTVSSTATAVLVRLNCSCRLDGPPVRVKSKLVLVGSGLGSVTLSMMMRPQLEMLTGIGAMKSLTAEVNASEERLLR